MAEEREPEPTEEQEDVELADDEADQVEGGGGGMWSGRPDKLGKNAKI